MNKLFTCFLAWAPINKATFIALLATSSNVFAELHPRDLDGDIGNGHEAVYDDVLDITWLANANLAATSPFTVSGVGANGTMSWDTANTYINTLNANSYFGINTWRLPTFAPVDGSSIVLTISYDGSTDNGFQISAPVDPTYNQSGQSANFTGNELAYHYYQNLSAIGNCSGIGSDNTYGCISDTISGVDDATNTENLALFQDIQNGVYWTGIAHPTDPLSAFTFFSSDGSQSTFLKFIGYSVWPVANGDHGDSLVEETNVPTLPFAGIILLAATLLTIYTRRSSNTN